MDRSVLPSLQRLVAALQQSQSVTRQISQVMRAAEEEASGHFTVTTRRLDLGRPSRAAVSGVQ